MNPPGQGQVLDEYKLILLTPLQWNNRKKLYVSLVEDVSGNKMVLKYCIPEANPSFSNFVNERSFYKENKANFIPKVIHIGENSLCTEYISGVSLLDHLKKQNISDQHAENIIGQVLDMNEYFKNNGIRNSGNKLGYTISYLSYLSKLINSGPWGKKRSSVENVFFKQYWRLLYRPLKNKIQILVESHEALLKLNLVHNDFHQNNILLDKNNKLYLIDYENYSQGYCSIDLLYGISTLYASRKMSRSIIYKCIAKEVEELPFILPLLNIYLCAVQTNRKFCKSSFWDITKNLIKLSAFAFFNKKI